MENKTRVEFQFLKLAHAGLLQLSDWRVFLSDKINRVPDDYDTVGRKCIILPVFVDLFEKITAIRKNLPGFTANDEEECAKLITSCNTFLRTKLSTGQPNPVQARDILSIFFDFTRHFVKKRGVYRRERRFMNEFFKTMLEVFIDPILARGKVDEPIARAFREMLSDAMHLQPPVFGEYDRDKLSSFFFKPWSYLRILMWITTYSPNEMIPRDIPYLRYSIGLSDGSHTLTSLLKLVTGRGKEQ